MSQSQSQSQKRKKEPNFSSVEVDVLVHNVYENREMLFGNFKGKMSLTVEKDREKIWSAITDKINAISRHPRVKDKVKEKWTYFKSDVKKKAAKVAKMKRCSGINEECPIELSSIEKMVVEMMGKTSVEGEEEGVDTFRFQKTQNNTRDENVVLSDVLADTRKTVFPDTHDRDRGSDNLDGVGDIEVVDENIDIPTTSTRCEAPTSSSSKASKRRRHSESVNDEKERYLQIEAEKLNVMKEKLKISREKLDVLKKINDNLEIIKEHFTTEYYS